MIEGQLQVKQGNTKRATELFLASSQRMDTEGIKDIDTELDRVLAMQALDQAQKAKETLKGLVVAFKDDEAALHKIDRLLDEPVSEESRKQVAKINKEGILLYEQKAYLKAIECFQRAKRLFPMHIGVQLNLVQALVGQLRTGDDSDEWMSSASICLKAVETAISATHPQYQRYRQLYDMVRQVELDRKARKSKQS